MTQEDKELLFRDLCARIPYNVKCYNSKYRPDLAEEIICITVNYNHHCVQLGTYLYKLEQVKPYLFPLSSMTEEEFTKLKEYSGLKYNQLDLASFQNGAYKCLDFYLSKVPSYVVIKVFDWLNKYHFDYRGLVQMDLAIDATGLNIY